MTLTIATRWRVTFRVQSLARVTMPPAAVVAAPKRPNLLAIAEARQMHEEMEMQRFGWEKEAMMCFRRML